MVCRTAPSPRPTASSSDRNPAPMPSMCGIVLRKPKFTPEANNIMLFGPGVIDVVNANSTRARNVSSGMIVSFRRTVSLHTIEPREKAALNCHGDMTISAAFEGNLEIEETADIAADGEQIRMRRCLDATQQPLALVDRTNLVGLHHAARLEVIGQGKLGRPRLHVA